MSSMTGKHDVLGRSRKSFPVKMEQEESDAIGDDTAVYMLACAHAGSR